MDTQRLTPFSLRDHRLIPRLGYATVRDHIIADLNAEYNSDNSRHYFPSAKARHTAALILAELPPVVYLSLPHARIDPRDLPAGASAIYPRHNGHRTKNYGGFVCRDSDVANDIYTTYLGEHKLAPGEERSLLQELERTPLPPEQIFDATLRARIDRGRTLHFTGEDRAQLLARIDAAHNATAIPSTTSIDAAIRTGLRILSQRGHIDDSTNFQAVPTEPNTTIFGILVAKTATQLAILTDDTTGEGVLLDRAGIRFSLRADGRSELTPNTLAPIAVRLDRNHTGFAMQTRSHDDSPARFDDRISTLLLATAMVDPSLQMVVGTDINDTQHDVDGTLCALTPYYAAVIDAGATIEPLSRTSIASGAIGDRFQAGPSFPTPPTQKRSQAFAPSRARA